MLPARRPSDRPGMAATTRLLVVLLLATLFGGCQGGPSPQPPASGTSGMAATPVRQDIRDAATLIHQQTGSHRLVLLGEKHGTQEAPQLAGLLLEAWSAQGPALLGLEVWQADQPLLDAYLHSGCRDEARAALHAGTFWQIDHDRHDGRRNRSALELIDSACRMRAAGRNVGIVAFDPGPGGQRDHHDRSRFMADTIHARFTALPANGRLLVVSGNVHAMLERPAHAPAQMQIPMGQHLRALGLDPYGIDLLARNGSFPACMNEGCGPMLVQLLPAGVHSSPTDGPYQLRVVLERFTPAQLLGRSAAPSSSHK